MRPPSRHLVGAAIVGAAFILGWTTAPAARPLKAAAAAAPTTTTTRPAALPSPPQANPSPPSHELSDADRTFLQFDSRAIGEHMAQRRPMVMELCKNTLPKASDAYCGRVFDADARVMPKFVETRQQLLRGEIDDATYQARWHAHFIERQIALEQFMSYDDKLRYDGTPPGDDNFLVLTVWGMYQPEEQPMGPAAPADSEPPDPATSQMERGFTPAPMTEKPQ